MYERGADRKLVGVEAVIDKDLASELLARELGADLFVMATEAPVVFIDYGKPEAKAIHRASPTAIRAYRFPAGSMGPKVDAACRFAEATGKTAAIGALADIPAMVTGKKGRWLAGRTRELPGTSEGLHGSRFYWGRASSGLKRAAPGQ